MPVRETSDVYFTGQKRRIGRARRPADQPVADAAAIRLKTRAERQHETAIGPQIHFNVGRSQGQVVPAARLRAAAPAAFGTRQPRVHRPPLTTTSTRPDAPYAEWSIASTLSTPCVAGRSVMRAKGRPVRLESPRSPASLHTMHWRPPCLVADRHRTHNLRRDCATLRHTWPRSTSRHRAPRAPLRLLAGSCSATRMLPPTRSRLPRFFSHSQKVVVRDTFCLVAAPLITTTQRTHRQHAG